MKPIPAKQLPPAAMRAAARSLPREEAYAQRREAKASRGKYGNKPTTIGGITFDSRAEARRYLYLQALADAGEITDLQRQVEFELIPGQKTPDGKKLRPTSYRADFTYRTKDGTLVVEDPKGASTPEWRIKRKLMLQVHGIWVKEIKT